MSVPYLPLYVADYEADTAHLTPEEDGVYLRLLRLCWRTPGCSIPDDPEWIARMIRVSPEFYAERVTPIIEEFFKRRKARLFSARLSAEFERIKSTSEKRSNAGRKGGRPRQEPEKKQEQEKPGKSKRKANGKHLDLDLDLNKPPKSPVNGGPEISISQNGHPVPVWPPECPYDKKLMWGENVSRLNAWLSAHGGQA